MLQKTFSYLISDWDGTLVDSMSGYEQVFTQLFSKEFHLPEENVRNTFHQMFGLALRNQILEVAIQANIAIHQTQTLEALFWQQAHNTKVTVIPGAKDFLKILKDLKIPVAVWSGSRTDIIREKVKELSFSPLIDFYIGNTPGNDKEVKGPGLFVSIAKFFGIPTAKLARECFVIGDGIGDIEAARAVGAHVGLFTLKTNAKRINEKADVEFATFDALLKTINFSSPTLL